MADMLAAKVPRINKTAGNILWFMVLVFLLRKWGTEKNNAQSSPHAPREGQAGVAISPAGFSDK
jgi:hypothetical protein